MPLIAPTRILVRSLFVLSPAWLCVPGFAQTAPDAGSLRQQLERDLGPAVTPPVPRTRAPDPAPTGPTAAPSAGPRVLIRGFVFEGNTLMGAQSLAQALDDAVGQSLGLAELRGLALRITGVYRDAGWLAAVVLPPQDLTEGRVTFRVIESVLSEVRAEGEMPGRIDVQQIEARLLARQRLGAPVSTRSIDRAVLLADDLPGVGVQGAYAAGAGEGQTRYLYRVLDEPLWTADARLENSGSRSTGSDRLGLGLTWNSALRRGDQIVLNSAHTRGSDFVRLGLSHPIGFDGWRLGLNVSWMQYRVITPEFAQLELQGRSTTQGLDLSYPLIRSANENLFFVATLDRKQFFNVSGTSVLSDYTMNSLQFGLNANRIDRIGLGGSSQAQLALAGLFREDEAGSTQPGAAARPARGTRLRYGFGRQQTLGRALQASVNLTGQWAARELDSSERFSLGGASGVRAYPAGEASASNAQLLNAQVQWRPAGSWTLTPFYDWGRVSPGGRDASFALHGPGLQANYTGPAGTFFSVVWARRIGSNPNASPQGQDQDGSLRLNRIWLSAGGRF